MILRLLFRLLTFALLISPWLLQAEEEGVLLRSFANSESPPPSFADGKFVPKAGETIAFLGGTDTFNQQRNGQLEMRLHLNWPELKLKVRNLGWQGDTVFYQARPQFFYTEKGDSQPGSLPDSRERTVPGIVFMDFGKLESLEGEGSLTRFAGAYDALVESFQKTRTGRIVLLSPTPFFATGPAATLAESRNRTLAQYVEAIRKLAGERGVIFVDLFHTVNEKRPASDWSENGTHLSENGQSLKAERIANALGFGAARPPDRKILRQAIQQKNRLWQQFYHPTNWAFLFGDRQHVPASRDHVDTKKRWFVDEVKALPELIAEVEADIYRYAGMEVAQ